MHESQSAKSTHSGSTKSELMKRIKLSKWNKNFYRLFWSSYPSEYNRIIWPIFNLECIQILFRLIGNQYYSQNRVWSKFILNIYKNCFTLLRFTP